MIASVREASCMSCRFFDLLEGQYGGQYGRCLRGPPQFIEPGVLNGGWPVVKQDEWCGEYDEHAE